MRGATRIWKEISPEEVLEGLRACNKDKASGPDGFTIGFLQVFWLVFKEYIMKLCDEFHLTENFVKSLNSTFIVLIPKVSGATTIKEY